MLNPLFTIHKREITMKRNPYPYLKVKIKSLAAEAKIIRAEELKFKKLHRGDDPYREGLYLHRVNKVRREARLSLLAYQFMRGYDYASCEQFRRKENELRKPQICQIAAMVKRFTPSSHPIETIQELVEKWISGDVAADVSTDRRLPSVRSHNGFSQSAA